MFELYLCLLLAGVVLQLSALLKNLLLQHANNRFGYGKSRLWDLSFVSGAIMMIVYSLHNVDVVLFTGEVILCLVYFRFSLRVKE